MKTKEVLQPENRKADRPKMELSTFPTVLFLAFVVAVVIPMFGAFFLSIQFENNIRQL